MTKRKIFLVKKMLLVIVVLVVAGISNAKGQVGRIYANSALQKSGSLTIENLNNAANNSNTFARVKSSSGLVIGLAAYQGEIELIFPSTIPAGKTSYMRIDANADLLKALLGGSLGNLLSNVVGSVA